MPPLCYSKCRLSAWTRVCLLAWKRLPSSARVSARLTPRCPPGVSPCCSVEIGVAALATHPMKPGKNKASMGSQPGLDLELAIGCWRHRLVEWLVRSQAWVGCSEESCQSRLHMPPLRTPSSHAAAQVAGQRDVPVVVGGASISPGDWLYADEGAWLQPACLGAAAPGLAAGCWRAAAWVGSQRLNVRLALLERAACGMPASRLLAPGLLLACNKRKHRNPLPVCIPVSPVYRWHPGVGSAPGNARCGAARGAAAQLRGVRRRGRQQRWCCPGGQRRCVGASTISQGRRDAVPVAPSYHGLLARLSLSRFTTLST